MLQFFKGMYIGFISCCLKLVFIISMCNVSNDNFQLNGHVGKWEYNKG